MQQQHELQQRQPELRLRQPTAHRVAFDAASLPTVFRAEPMGDQPDGAWWGISRANSKTYEIMGPPTKTTIEDEVFR